MKMKKYNVVLLAVAMLGMSVATASATYMADISYTGTQSGNTHTFTFDVKNTSDGGSTGALDFFQINFDADADATLYSAITWTADQGWASEADDYDPGFGGIPGFVSADDSVFGSGGGGIAQGDHQGGFKVSFEYTGSFAIDEQLFSWSAEFGTEDDGQGGYRIMGSADGLTRYVQGGPPPVPEPATMLLMGTGLAGLVAARRKKSQ